MRLSAAHKTLLASLRGLAASAVRLARRASLRVVSGAYYHGHGPSP